MLAAVIRLYLDESLTPKIAVQLRRRGVDIVTVHELGLTGESDAMHLGRAASMGRVLVTADTDFLVMASGGAEHSGIVFGIQEQLSLGDWVNGLELVVAAYTAEEMINHVVYL